MPQLNLFGNTSIFADTGSTDIFGNQSSDIFAAEDAAMGIFINAQVMDMVYTRQKKMQVMIFLKMILKMCKSLHGLITTMMKMI